MGNTGRLALSGTGLFVQNPGLSRLGNRFDELQQSKNPHVAPTDSLVRVRTGLP